MSLENALRYFDVAEKKEILIVYVQRTINENNMNTFIEKYILGNADVVEKINRTFSFVGILDSNPEIAALKKYDIDPKFFPCLLFFSYDLFDELKLCKMVNFDKNILENEPESIGLCLNDIRKIIRDQRKEESIFLTELKKKQKILTDLNFVRYRRPVPINEPIRPVLSIDQERKLEEERAIRREQDIAYQRMLSLKREEEKLLENIKNTEKQAILSKLEEKQNKEALLLKFNEREIDPHDRIDICFRFPNGIKKQGCFGRKEKAFLLHEFVQLNRDGLLSLESSEFQIETGFPVKIVDPLMAIGDFFGEGGSELVHVKEFVPE